MVSNEMGIWKNRNTVYVLKGPKWNFEEIFLFSEQEKVMQVLGKYGGCSSINIFVFW